MKTKILSKRISTNFYLILTFVNQHLIPYHVGLTFPNFFRELDKQCFHKLWAKTKFAKLYYSRLKMYNKTKPGFLLFNLGFSYSKWITQSNGLGKSLASARLVNCFKPLHNIVFIGLRPSANTRFIGVRLSSHFNVNSTVFRWEVSKET